MSNLCEVKSENKKTKFNIQKILFWLLFLAFSGVLAAIFGTVFIIFNALSTNSNEPSNTQEEKGVEPEEEEEEPENVQENLRKAAIRFNNDIVDMQSLLIKNFESLGQAIATRDTELINSEYENALKAANNSLKALKEMAIIPGGEKLHSAATDLFEFYFVVLEDNYKEVITAINSGATDTEEQIDKLIKDIAVEEVKLDVEFRKGQERLAEEHNFSLN